MDMNKITYLHSELMFITGVKSVIQGQWTHIWANLKDKRKTKNKRMFLSGACNSNIDVQRIVDNHTNYMVRARPKCKIDREISEHWSV